MKKLREMLDILIKKHGLTAIKGGTEVEDMTFNELVLIKELTYPVIPMIVKIGGPEARNDMREMKQMGAEGILAPMVESEYALKNFIESLHDIYSGSDLPYCAINIETITAYKNLGSIMGSPAFAALSQVTVGRTDLSGSMNMRPDDEEVLMVTGEIVRLAQEAGKTASVGGAIDPSNALKVSEIISPDLINTRHMVFSLKKAKDICEAVHYGLLFEIELYRKFMEIEPSKEAAYRRRMDTTMNRIIKAELAMAMPVY